MEGRTDRFWRDVDASLLAVDETGLKTFESTTKNMMACLIVFPFDLVFTIAVIPRVFSLSPETS